MDSEWLLMQKYLFLKIQHIVCTEFFKSTDLCLLLDRKCQEKDKQMKPHRLEFFVMDRGLGGRLGWGRGFARSNDRHNIVKSVLSVRVKMLRIVWCY